MQTKLQWSDVTAIINAKYFSDIIYHSHCITFPAVTVLNVSISLSLVSLSGICSTYPYASCIILVTACFNWLRRFVSMVMFSFKAFQSLFLKHSWTIHTSTLDVECISAACEYGGIIHNYTSPLYPIHMNAFWFENGDSSLYFGLASKQKFILKNPEYFSQICIDSKTLSEWRHLNMETYVLWIDEKIAFWKCMNMDVMLQHR